ncbi:MAG: hypothetical protein MK132_07700 [Lentisphaerales bacterium]|nr:hypothetical protein [Lentisphaerales bacterium]
MNDSQWQDYTVAGNYFFDEQEYCCACTNYQNALSEAEKLLTNSYDISEDIPVIQILIISYCNLFALCEEVQNITQLRSYIRRATYALTGILKSSEFPCEVRNSCKKEIYSLYHSISEYCQKHHEIIEDSADSLKEITDVMIKINAHQK